MRPDFDGQERRRRINKARRRRLVTTVLRRALRDLGLTRMGRAPSVRTRKNSHGEYMDYCIHVDRIGRRKQRMLESFGFEVHDCLEFCQLYHCGVFSRDEEQRMADNGFPRPRCLLDDAGGVE